MRSNNTKVILITAAISIVSTSLVWVGVGSLWYNLNISRPPAFAVTVTHPEPIEVGETFKLSIEVANPTTDAISLGSIDVYRSILDGFEVLDVKPKPTTRGTDQDYTSFYFRESIEPSESFTFELTLRANAPGIWGGDIDCCTPFENFVTRFTELSVIEPASPTPPSAE